VKRYLGEVGYSPKHRCFCPHGVGMHHCSCTQMCSPVLKSPNSFLEASLFKNDWPQVINSTFSPSPSPEVRMRAHFPNPPVTWLVPLATSPILKLFKSLQPPSYFTSTQKDPYHFGDSKILYVFKTMEVKTKIYYFLL
jgi:hypothetical protein